jgi:hypothetical protein
MKKIIFITCCLLLSIFGVVFNSYSQLNHFFPDSNAYFSVSAYKFYFHGDTLIDSKKYKKVFTHSVFSNSNYLAAVREDTIGMKIYSFFNDDHQERLIYDFSLEAGDTASIYTYWPFRTAEKKHIKVVHVDSILINNQYRRRLEIERGDFWVEGIGSIEWGLFFPVPFGWADLGLPKLLCIHENDLMIWQRPGYNTCFEDIDVSISEKNPFSFHVFPTATRDMLYIKTSLNLGDTFRYKIFNNQGMELTSGLLETESIEVSFLKAGLYYLAIYDKGYNSKYYIQKFIKF